MPEAAGQFSYTDLEWERVCLDPCKYRDKKEVRSRQNSPMNTSLCRMEEDGERLYLAMQEGTGKVTDCGYDQFAAWFTRLPAGTDLVFSARVTVTSFLADGPATGQEGFGLFLRDTMELDGETGFPYSNMAAAGACCGRWNLFGRSGVTAGSIENVNNFCLYGMNRGQEDCRVLPGEPRDFDITIVREGGVLRAGMTDGSGAQLLAAGDPGQGASGSRGFFTDREGRCCLRIPEDLLDAKEKGCMYAGFFAARGTSLSVRKESVRLRLYHAPEERRDGACIFASPEGSPDGEGSRSRPWDLKTALACGGNGRTVALLPGTYEIREDLVIRKRSGGGCLCGTGKTARETVLDFGGTPHGLLLEDDCWEVRGLTVRGGMGLQVSGSRNLVRGCIACSNLETGFLVRHPEADSPKEAWPSFNRIEDCVSFLNMDPSERNADGFACKVAAGEGNLFLRCLAYLNSDDGFDLFVKNRRTGAAELRECRSFLNGYVLEPDGTLRRTRGNGNGFKLGGSGLAVAHKAFGCEAAGNAGAGFTSNSNPFMELDRCRAGNNGKDNISFYFCGPDSKVKKTIRACTEYDDPEFDPAEWLRRVREDGERC